MALSFPKTVAIKNPRLSFLYYTYLGSVLIGFILWCVVGKTLEQKTVVSATTVDTTLHVQLRLPSLTSAELASSTLQAEPSRFGELCGDALEINHTCAGTAVSCAGASISCLADRDVNILENSREVFITTAYELSYANADNSSGPHKAVLTTADAQSVGLRYSVAYHEGNWRSLGQLFTRNMLSPEGTRRMVRDDTAYTVVLDSADRVWARISGEEASRAGGIRITLHELLALSGIAPSDSPHSWLEAFVSGVELGLHVSCYDSSAEDDEQTASVWDGATCYVRIQHHQVHDQAVQSAAPRTFSTTRWVPASDGGGLQENHLNWRLSGVRVVAEISRISWRLNAVRLMVHLVVLFLLLFVGKEVMYYVALLCLGNLSTVYRGALVEPFSIMGEVARSTVESVVRGLCYREMDTDNSLDASGTLPVSSVRNQVEQLVRSMQPTWSDEQVSSFSALAVRSLRPSRRKGCCERGCACFFRCCCPREKEDEQSNDSPIDVDRFVSASSTQKQSKLEALEQLFRKSQYASCSLSGMLERLFMPKEVTDHQWKFEQQQESTKTKPQRFSLQSMDSWGPLRGSIFNSVVIKSATASGTAGSHGLEARRQSRDSRATDVTPVSGASPSPSSPRGGGGGGQRPMIVSALADEDQGPVPPPYTSDKSARESAKAVRIADDPNPLDEAASPTLSIGAGGRQRPIMAPSKSLVSKDSRGRGGHSTTEANALMAGPVELVARLQHPSSKVQYSTRAFAAQLADMDRTILQMLCQIEDKQSATLAFWRTKAQLLADRMDTLEADMRSLDEYLEPASPEQPGANNSNNNGDMPGRRNTMAKDATRSTAFASSATSRQSRARGGAALDAESKQQLDSMSGVAEELHARLDSLEEMMSMLQLAGKLGPGVGMRGVTRSPNNSDQYAKTASVPRTATPQDAKKGVAETLKDSDAAAAAADPAADFLGASLVAGSKL